MTKHLRKKFSLTHVTFKMSDSVIKNEAICAVKVLMIFVNRSYTIHAAPKGLRH